MKCESCGIENVATVQSPADSNAKSGPGVMFHTIIVLVDLLRRLVFFLPILGSAYAAFDLWSNWEAQRGAPQQAALAGYVLACAIVPYCFARAFSGLTERR
jgi:hypothetical protein